MVGEHAGSRRGRGSAVRLDAEDRACVAEAAEALRDLTSCEWAYLGAARAVARLAKGAFGTVARWDPSGARETGFTAVPRVRTYSDTFPRPAAAAAQLSTLARHPVDPFEGAAVSLGAMAPAGDDGGWLEAARHDVLEPLGAVDQIRVATSSFPGSAHRFCLLFPATCPRDLARELARLSALVPALRDAEAALRAMGTQLESVNPVAASIDLFDEPAWLCDERGRVVHANAATRYVPTTQASDVTAAVRSPRLTGARFRVRPLVLGDRKMVLVLDALRARAPRAEEERHTGLEALLSPQLSRVARLAAQGSDVEAIVRRTGLTQATVRMYLQRSYAKLGIRSRAELVAFVAELERS